MSTVMAKQPKASAATVELATVEPTDTVELATADTDTVELATVATDTADTDTVATDATVSTDTADTADTADTDTVEPIDDGTGQLATVWATLASDPDSPIDGATGTVPATVASELASVLRGVGAHVSGKKRNIFRRDAVGALTAEHGALALAALATDGPSYLVRNTGLSAAANAACDALATPDAAPTVDPAILARDAYARRRWAIRATLDALDYAAAEAGLSPIDVPTDGTLNDGQTADLAKMLATVEKAFPVGTPRKRAAASASGSTTKASPTGHGVGTTADADARGYTVGSTWRHGKDGAHVATVGTADGKATFTVGGTVYASSTAAARAVNGGKSVNGYVYWNTAVTA